MKTYTVQAGDTLFLIAKQFYGDGYLYKLLAAYNHLRNPNALEVGKVLNIPSARELQSAGNPVRDWHNYGNGTLYWRATSRGVEIKGRGLIKDPNYTRRAKTIWTTYRQPIIAASQKHGVPVPAIIATIITESSGKPRAYRPEPEFYQRYIRGQDAWKLHPLYESSEKIAASYGLMQIMYTTAYSVGFRGKPDDLYDPAVNIDVASAYIASPFQKKQHQWDPPKIACAYNAGSVRPTKKNEWGMFYHPGHLDRWIPAYNGAVEAIENERLSALIEPAETEEDLTPPTTTPLTPAADAAHSGTATLRILFPHTETASWTPVIIDLFRHTDVGLSDPMSYTVTTPARDSDAGDAYEISNVAKGMYDLVFADTVSSSIVYEIADYEITPPKITLDLRRPAASATETTPSAITVILRFPKEIGQSWKPMIVDVARCDGEQAGGMASYQIRKLTSGTVGEYLYEIPGLTKGVYDFILTDLKSRSVVYTVANYVVDQSPEIIDLRKSRGIVNEHQQIQARNAPSARVKALVQKITAWFLGD